MVVKRIRRVKISSLPKSIAIHKITLPVSDTAPSLAATVPHPRPKLLMAAMTELTAERKSSPVLSIASTKIKDENM